MKYSSFQEYFDSKGNKGKTFIDPIGDRVDPMTPPDRPKAGGKPYVASDGRNPTKTPQKGFGDDGDRGLVWEPEVWPAYNHRPVKMPVVERAELATLVADAVAQDPTVLESVVGHIKRRGLLGALVAEVLQHRKTYSVLAEVMGHRRYGPGLCDKIVGAMHEEVASPFGDQLAGEDENEHEDEDEDDMPNDDQGDGAGIDDDDIGDEGMENPDEMGDPNGMGGQDPSMDPNVVPSNEDPSLAGMGMGDPNGTPEQPNGMGQPFGAGQQTVDPMMGGDMPPAMKHFQRAFQRAMMRKA